MAHDRSRRFLLRIASAALLVAAGCSAPPAAHPVNDVHVVSSDSRHPIVPPFAFNQLQPGFRKVIRRTGHKVFSISDGLADVRAASNNPIVAATEQDGWLFYATSMATSSEAETPPQFISGYAIKHGTREIFYWSVW